MLHRNLHLAHPLLPSCETPSPPPDSSAARRRWTEAQVSELVEALSGLRTSDIAKLIGINPKALRSLLRRNGISLRAVREQAASKDRRLGTGLLLRRTGGGPSAAFGAAALAALPDSSCRWPLGDPSEPEFSFCTLPRCRRHSYCEHHLARARYRLEDDHGL